LNTILWLRWIAVNGIFAGILIAGFVYDIAWAQKVYIGMVSFAVGSFLALLYLRKGLKIMTNQLRPIPLWLDKLYDFASFGVLVWSGHIVLAVAYIVSMLGIVNIMRGCTYDLKEGEING
jgi:hypothetical protein